MDHEEAAADCSNSKVASNSSGEGEVASPPTSPKSRRHSSSVSVKALAKLFQDQQQSSPQVNLLNNNNNEKDNCKITFSNLAAKRNSIQLALEAIEAAKSKNGSESKISHECQKSSSSSPPKDGHEKSKSQNDESGADSTNSFSSHNNNGRISGVKETGAKDAVAEKKKEQEESDNNNPCDRIIARNERREKSTNDSDEDEGHYETVDEESAMAEDCHNLTRQIINGLDFFNEEKEMDRSGMQDEDLYEVPNDELVTANGASESTSCSRNVTSVTSPETVKLPKLVKSSEGKTRLFSRLTLPKKFFNTSRRPSIPTSYFTLPTPGHHGLVTNLSNNHKTSNYNLQNRKLPKLPPPSASDLADPRPKVNRTVSSPVPGIYTPEPCLQKMLRGPSLPSLACPSASPPNPATCVASAKSCLSLNANTSKSHDVLVSIDGPRNYEEAAIKTLEVARAEEQLQLMRLAEDEEEDFDPYYDVCEIQEELYEELSNLSSSDGYFDGVIPLSDHEVKGHNSFGEEDEEGYYEDIPGGSTSNSDQIYEELPESRDYNTNNFVGTTESEMSEKMQLEMCRQMSNQCNLPTEYVQLDSCPGPDGKRRLVPMKSLQPNQMSKLDKKSLDFNKKREIEFIKLKYKYNLTGQEVPVNYGTVKEDVKWSKNRLKVRKGETVLIIRLEGNPPGLCLAKNEKSHIGYVELSNVRCDPLSVKTLMNIASSNNSSPLSS